MIEGTAQRPTDPQPQMSRVVRRNIDALLEVRRREERLRGVSDRLADGVTRFAGSMWFVYVHLVLYGGWLLINGGVIRLLPPWDPYPFVMLAMTASVEAIFLSTFILISQNRMQRLADRRAELDLQVSLLAEHELTRAIQILDAMSQKLGMPQHHGPELQEIKHDVHPERVVEAIEQAERRQEADAS